MIFQEGSPFWEGAKSAVSLSFQQHLFASKENTHSENIEYYPLKDEHISEGERILAMFYRRKFEVTTGDAYPFFDPFQTFLLCQPLLRVDPCSCLWQLGAGPRSLLAAAFWEAWLSPAKIFNFIWGPYLYLPWNCFLSALKELVIF